MPTRMPTSSSTQLHQLISHLSSLMAFGRLDRKKTRGRFGETSFLLRRTYLCACPSIFKPFAGLTLGFDSKKKKNYERLLVSVT